MYYTQEQIDRANQADLVSFLQGRGEQLTRAGQEYRWKRHDSLTIRGNKWYLEPMINAGVKEVKTLEDGWTTVTADGKLSAHFEHTIAITPDGPVIMTLPE